MSVQSITARSFFEEERKKRKTKNSNILIITITIDDYNNNKYI